MNKCYFTRTAYQQFHMPLQTLHKQFSRQCLCKGLVKGQKSQGSVLTKTHISPSITLSTQLNLYSTREPSFSANIRQHVSCVGKDKSTTKVHVASPDMTTNAGAWPPKSAGKPHSQHTTESLSHSVADSRVQNAASENNDNKTSKGPHCLLNA